MPHDEILNGPRIAVVGSGPRALWALERLLEHLRSGNARVRPVIEVFGPGPLGAGPNYHPDQPEFLRLNLPVDRVDVWSLSGHRGPSMADWRGTPTEAGELAVYPSRARTGRYLAEQAADVVAQLDRLGVPVRHHRQLVERVTGPYAEGSATPSTAGVRGGRGGGWWVDDVGPVDEVLLATGHPVDWPGALRHTWSAGLPPLHPVTFPVQDLVAREELVPGAGVLVRGAGLTGIDAALALTTGRGQTVAGCDLRIVLVSRSGRMMVPKSPADLVRATHARAGDPARFVDQAVGLVRAGRGAELPGVLHDLAAHLLVGATGSQTGEARRQVEHVVEDLHSGDEPAEPVVQLRSAVAVARGDVPPDGTWALGQAWRVLQGDLARAQQELDPDGPPLGWPDYAMWGPELERLGYGPSLMHAEFLVAAMEAGVVQVRRGDTAQLARELRPDLVVDAVLPPPGVRDLPDGHVLRHLVDDGVLVPARGHRGARVGCAAEVLDPAGSPVPGLSLVGRAAEGAVLAADTLLRDMHPAVDLWAQRVLGVRPERA
ncbi:FAD/NAD(P)-binding protein [Ornithinimicrobium cavernae]|uniref:FAD/NAD(P)-binding protein n=1 Tax=Ornithinimicrobium cavernae TaxID=2666047 RepID=UPI000D69A447|nr:FAD/NAD(P)-binding protein [Ornithinimicrobium cavernae]